MTPATRSWKYRRRAAFIALLGAIAGLLYLIGWGDDTDLHRRIADGLASIVIWVIAIYVGGATADDALRDFAQKGLTNEPDHMAPHGRGIPPER